MPTAQKKSAKKSARKTAAPRKAAVKTSKKTSSAAPADPIPVVKDLRIRPGKPGKVLSSDLRYEGPLFRIFSEEVEEPTGKRNRRDIIRHNGSVVILAVDTSKSRRDPLIVIERQYRHAAQQFLYEVPAGKMEPGEDRLAAAKRELLEETGYTARKWKKLVRYFASPGFLGEWMQVFLAEDLVPGVATPEDDESLELQRVPLSELLRLIERGQIQDGKTLVSVLCYARSLGKK
jgi:ADP-ribose pyrophosphatase